MFAGTQRDGQMIRLLGRYGFELVPAASPLTLGERARRFGENILIKLVVLTRNAASLRSDTLRPRPHARVHIAAGARAALRRRRGAGRCLALGRRRIIGRRNGGARISPALARLQIRRRMRPRRADIDTFINRAEKATHEGRAFANVAGKLPAILTGATGRGV
jgi:hypothetical protein